jgi:hypothetical protein
MNAWEKSRLFLRFFSRHRKITCVLIPPGCLYTLDLYSHDILPESKSATILTLQLSIVFLLSLKLRHSLPICRIVFIDFWPWRQSRWRDRSHDGF